MRGGAARTLGFSLHCYKSVPKGHNGFALLLGHVGGCCVRGWGGGRAPWQSSWDLLLLEESGTKQGLLVCSHVTGCLTGALSWLLGSSK